MFLTTEPILQGRQYQVIRVIHATKNGKSGDKGYEQAINEAFGRLESKAIALQADGVIGVQISTSVWSEWSQVTVIGTAIKFY
jgi:uncharacterized protein YbjQ (UPF0145 family)